MKKWIKISDKRPSDNEVVVVLYYLSSDIKCCPSIFMMLAVYDASNNSFKSETYKQHQALTHWCALPQIPDDKEVFGKDLKHPSPWIARVRNTKESE